MRVVEWYSQKYSIRTRIETIHRPTLLKGRFNSQKYSIRTRIETVACSAFSVQARRILRSIPLEQGLKRYSFVCIWQADGHSQKYSIRTRIETNITPDAPAAPSTYSQKYSIRTRIETVGVCRLPPCKRHSQKYSIRTRIETHIWAARRDGFRKILRSIPLEQGLKPVSTFAIMVVFAPILRSIPLEQGLKPIRWPSLKMWSAQFSEVFH